jgi:anthranilate 1,2-dioxygenase small subunit
MNRIKLADGESLFAEEPLAEMILWYSLHRLQERYVTVIDSGRLEEWPDLFTEDGVYEIVPKENADLGLPVGIMHCFGRAMMCDRIISLREANLFEPHTYRHMTSGLEFTQVDADTVDMQSNYVVIQTLTNGESTVYQAGRYFDRVVRTAEGWRYQRKRAVYDTSRVPTLLVTPV